MNNTKLVQKYFFLFVGVFSIVIVSLWVHSIIRRYDASIYLLVSITATLSMLLLFIDYKKSLIYSIIIGTLIGYCVGLFSNLFLEFVFVEGFVEKFSRGVETMPSALFTVVLGFPILLGSWFLGGCLSFSLWHFKQRRH